LSGIRTLALQQAVASDPTLALDILLDTLAAQLVHGVYSYRLAASVSPIRHAPEIDDVLMSGSSIVRVEDAMGQRFADLPEEGRFAAIRTMDPADKMQLLAGLVAITIDATRHNGGGDETRLRTADGYAEAAGLNMADVWAPGCEVFTRMKKGALLALLAEACGQNAADNCAKMKRNDLAVAVAERLPAGWMPTPVTPLPAFPSSPKTKANCPRLHNGVPVGFSDLTGPSPGDGYEVGSRWLLTALRWGLGIARGQGRAGTALAFPPFGP
jgi:ParB family chromosome partitioning protein